jgi:hypothetical protein
MLIKFDVGDAESFNHMYIWVSMIKEKNWIIMLLIQDTWLSKVMVNRKHWQKIITFQQGNKYVPRVLVVVIQAIKKNPINYVVWFSQKLQNKTITV